MRTLTVKIPESLSARIAAVAKARKTTRSVVIRAALASLEEPPVTVGDLTADLAGAVCGPGDLLSNPDHMEGFGDE